MPIPAADAPASLTRRLLHYIRPRQLQLIVRMSELGAIQKAAASLGMSQPSATEALNRVEELLGLTLFDRHARGVRLTREGAHLMPALKRTLAAIEMLATDAAHIGQGANGAVRIAGISAASSSVIAPALPGLCALHPDIWIDYREIEAAEVSAICQDDGADMILCRAAVEVIEGYVFAPLKEDRLGVYCASGHPLAKRRTLSLNGCAGATWLLPPAGSPPHRAFLELCSQMGGPPKLARVDTRASTVSVALVRHLQLLYIGLESQLGRFVDSGQLVRLPVAVPGSLDAIGLLHREQLKSAAAEAVTLYLKRWAAHG